MSPNRAKRNAVAVLSVLILLLSVISTSLMRSSASRNPHNGLEGCGVRQWIALLILLLASTIARASGVAVPGVIQDPSGAVVPGATVTLQHLTGTIRFAVQTDVFGRFRFETVPQGTYALLAQHDGFAPVTLRLEIGTIAPETLSILLPLSGVASAVSVEAADDASVSVGHHENDASASLDGSLMKYIPIFDQDYLGTMAAFLDPAVIGTSGPDLILNGVSVANVMVSPSAIQATRINHNPYAAEYARPGKGTVEIISKTPTAEYHSTMNVVVRNASFNGRDAFALTRPPEERRIYEGMLSGPLVYLPSTSFLVSGSRQEEDLQSIVVARGLLGRIDETVASPQRRTLFSSQLTHEFSPAHTLDAQYSGTLWSGRNQGVGATVLSEAGRNAAYSRSELVLTDRLIVARTWLTQFQLAIGRERQSITSVRPWPKIVVVDTLTSGGAQLDWRELVTALRLNARLSWSGHGHTVQFGLEVPDWSTHRANERGNFGGTFFFANLEDYAAEHPYAFRKQHGVGDVVFQQQELAGFVQDEYLLTPQLSFAVGIRYSWQNYLHGRRHVAPRIAFAYGLGRRGKTVLRGGAGIFYDRIGSSPIADVLLHDARHLQSYLITDPLYPDATATLHDLPATDLVRFDPAIREPYMTQYSIGVEHHVSNRTILAATYTGSVGIGLFRSRDANAPTGPTYSIRPNPAFGFVRHIESAGRQMSNMLDVTLRGPITHSLTGVLQYTVSRTQNNTGGIFWMPANQYDWSGEWSLADFNQTHRLAVLERLDVHKFFTLGLALSVSSGKPYSLTTGEDLFHTGIGNTRPQGVPRNSLEGPAFVNVDVRWSRDFSRKRAHHEHGTVTTLMVDAFNALNHVNNVAYVGNLKSPFYGRAVAAYPARRVQFTLKYTF